jgi:small subunit ribosomal protein S8
VAHHPEIVCPSSKLRHAIAKVLSAEGYLGEVRVEKRDGKDVLVMRVRYDGSGRALIAGLRRVSRPGRRVYVASSEIPKVRSGLGVAVISTSKGVLPDREARAASMGGELLRCGSDVTRRRKRFRSERCQRQNVPAACVKGPRDADQRMPPRRSASRREGLGRAHDEDKIRARCMVSRARSEHGAAWCGPFIKGSDQGVGYRADVASKTLKLLLGFSHPVELAIRRGSRSPSTRT